MDLLAVMTEVAARLDTIPGLRAFATPPDSAPAPFACCGAPETPDGHPLTYNRASGRLTLPVLICVSLAVDRVAWESVLDYTSDDGPQSAILALEVPDEYTAFDTLQVRGWEFGEATFNEVPYRAVNLDVDIVG